VTAPIGPTLRLGFVENFSVLATRSRVVRYGAEPILVLLRVFLDFLKRQGERLAQRMRDILWGQCQHESRSIVLRLTVPKAEYSVLDAFRRDEPKRLRHGLLSRLERKFGHPWLHA